MKNWTGGHRQDARSVRCRLGGFQPSCHATIDHHMYFLHTLLCLIREIGCYATKHSGDNGKQQQIIGYHDRNLSQTFTLRLLDSFKPRLFSQPDSLSCRSTRYIASRIESMFVGSACDILDDHGTSGEQTRGTFRLTASAATIQKVSLRETHIARSICASRCWNLWCLCHSCSTRLCGELSNKLRIFLRTSSPPSTRVVFIWKYSALCSRSAYRMADIACSN